MAAAHLRSLYEIAILPRMAIFTSKDLRPVVIASLVTPAVLVNLAVAIFVLVPVELAAITLVGIPISLIVSGCLSVVFALGFAAQQSGWARRALRFIAWIAIALLIGFATLHLFGQLLRPFAREPLLL